MSPMIVGDGCWAVAAAVWAGDVDGAAVVVGGGGGGRIGAVAVAGGSGDGVGYCIGRNVVLCWADCGRCRDSRARAAPWRRSAAALLCS